MLPRFFLAAARRSFTGAAATVPGCPGFGQSDLQPHSRVNPFATTLGRHFTDKCRLASQCRSRIIVIGNVKSIHWPLIIDRASPDNVKQLAASVRPFPLQSFEPTDR